MINLEELLAPYTSTEVRHEKLLLAARDDSITTDFLFKNAREEVRIEHEIDEDAPFGALLILHYRNTDEVLERALQHLYLPDRIDRVFAAKLLREFPAMGQSTPEHALKIIQAMKERLLVEKDVLVIRYCLYAIGWQNQSSGLDFLLTYASDPRSEVRAVVAYCILHDVGDATTVRPPVADAFRAFFQDEDPEIRWSVYYDLQAFPELFKPWAQEFISILRESRLAEPQRNMTIKAQAIQALLTGRSSDSPIAD